MPTRSSAMWREAADRHDGLPPPLSSMGRNPRQTRIISSPHLERGVDARRLSLRSASWIRVVEQHLLAPATWMSSGGRRREVGCKSGEASGVRQVRGCPWEARASVVDSLPVFDDPGRCRPLAA